MTSLTDFVTITDGVARFVKSLVAHHSERSEEFFDDFNAERQNTILQSCSFKLTVYARHDHQNKTSTYHNQRDFRSSFCEFPNVVMSLCMIAASRCPCQEDIKAPICTVLLTSPWKNLKSVCEAGEEKEVNICPVYSIQRLGFVRPLFTFRCACTHSTIKCLINVVTQISVQHVSISQNLFRTCSY